MGIRADVHLYSAFLQFLIDIPSTYRATGPHQPGFPDPWYWLTASLDVAPGSAVTVTVALVGDAALKLEPGPQPRSEVVAGGLQGPENALIGTELTGRPWALVDEVHPVGAPPIPQVAIVASARDSDRDGNIQLEIRGMQPRGEFIYDTPTGLAFAFPRIEHPFGMSVAPDRMAGSEGMPPSLLERTWLLAPVTLDARMRLANIAPGDRLLAAPSPDEFDGVDASWAPTSDITDLVVSGAVIDDVAAAEAQHNQFLAGVFVGLSGGLAVLGFELMIEALWAFNAERRAFTQAASARGRDQRRLIAALRYRRVRR
jgi:hypothetical protein